MADTLNRKHQRFIEEYLKCFNGTRAYMVVYPKASYETAMANAAKLLGSTKIAEIVKARLDEAHMTADKALKNISEIADADIGVFWKVVDEWMFYPLPEYEILDEQEVVIENEDGSKTKKISYRVRHVALDMDKIIDPRYSHLIQEFSNNRRRGMSIKTYSRHDANRDILKVHGRFAPEKIDLTNSDGTLGVIRVIEHKDE